MWTAEVNLLNYRHRYIHNMPNKILDTQANIYMSHDQACLSSVSNPQSLIMSGMLADRSTTPTVDNIPTTCNNNNNKHVQY